MTRHLPTDDTPAAAYGPFSWFNSVKDTAPARALDLADFIALTRAPKGFEGTFAKLRAGVAPSEKERLKKSLPAATLSGTFSTRKKEGLTSHAGLLQLDFDGIPTERQADLAAKLERDPYTLAGFVSPTGLGYKAVVRIAADGASHERSAQAAHVYYKALTGHEPDKSCKDVSRLCFLSSDAGAWLKDTAAVLPTDMPTGEVDRGAACLAWCAEEVAKRKGPYTAGYRNAHVNTLAVMAKKYGVSEADTLAYVARLSDGDAAQDAENMAVVYTVYGDAALPFGTATYTLPRAGAKPATTPKPAAPAAKAGKEKKEGGYDKEPSEKPQPAFVQAINYLSKRYRFRMNSILKVAEIAPKDSEEWKEVNDSDLLTELWNVGFNLAEAKLFHWLKLSMVPLHNPILAYFETLPAWSKEEGDRIEHLFSYLVLQDEAGHRTRLNTQGKKWLVRAVATAIKPGEVNKQIFTLQGEGQNFGKTTFARFLCPPALKAYETENITFDKDGEIVFTQNMLGNMDELPQLKADMERLKQATSKDKIKVRAPYEKKPVEADRIISFLATTNKAEFLEDPTGSVRWLIFSLESIKHANGKEGGYSHDVDINRVWAQAYTLYKSGYGYHMTQVEQLENEAANRSKTRQTHEYQLVAAYLSPASGGMEEKVRYWPASQVLEYLKWSNPNLQYNGGAERIGIALTQHGYGRRGVRLNGNRNPVKCYEILETPRVLEFLATQPTTPTTDAPNEHLPF